MSSPLPDQIDQLWDGPRTADAGRRRRPATAIAAAVDLIDAGQVGSPGWIPTAMPSLWTSGRSGRSCSRSGCCRWCESQVGDFRYHDRVPLTRTARRRQGRGRRDRAVGRLRRPWRRADALFRQHRRASWTPARWWIPGRRSGRAPRSARMSICPAESASAECLSLRTPSPWSSRTTLSSGPARMVVNGARVRTGAVLGAGTILTPDHARDRRANGRGTAPRRGAGLVGLRQRHAWPQRSPGGEFGMPCVLVLKRLADGRPARQGHAQRRSARSRRQRLTVAAPARSAAIRLTRVVCPAQMVSASPLPWHHLVVYFVLLAAAIAILARRGRRSRWAGAARSRESSRDLPVLSPRIRTAADIARLRLPVGLFGYQEQATDEALTRPPG